MPVHAALTFDFANIGDWKPQLDIAYLVEDVKDRTMLSAMRSSYDHSRNSARTYARTHARKHARTQAHAHPRPQSHHRAV